MNQQKKTEKEITRKEIMMREKLDENRRIREKTKTDYSRPSLDLGSYDGDDDASAPKKFTWNRDPSESLSDWTIIVTTKGVDKAETTSNTYHIHKHVVGAGPRGSKHFLKLFQSENSQEGVLKEESSISKLELYHSAATAFPEMLDFMYDFDPKEVRAQTDTAVALRYLANHFEVPTLFESVNKFIEDDMNRENIHIYVREARKYEDEIIINATMVIAAEAWEDMLLAKDGTPIEKSAYIDQLSESDQLELMKRALSEAFFECKRSKSRYNYHYSGSATKLKLTSPDDRKKKVGAPETPRTSETPRRNPVGIKARLESRGTSAGSVGSNTSETSRRAKRPTTRESSTRSAIAR